VTPTVTFTCSICGEPSGSICVYCTKDACGNHICDKCQRCSDCCDCEIHLDEHPKHERQFRVEALEELAAEELAPAAAEAHTAAPAEPEAASSEAIAHPSEPPSPHDDPPVALPDNPEITPEPAQETREPHE
jgi:hypothetical protein